MSTTSEQDLPELREEEDLRFTRHIRKQLISSMMENGKPPTETKDRVVLLAALNDMDRVTIGLKKIKTDEGLGNKQLAAAAMLAEVLNDSRIKQIGKVDVVEGVTRTLPTFDESCVATDVKPGELDIAPQSETYTAFTQRMGMGAQ